MAGLRVHQPTRWNTETWTATAPQISPRAAVLYVPNEVVTAKLLYGQAFRAASARELFIILPQGDRPFAPEAKANLRLAASNNAWCAAEAVDLLYHAAGGSSIYRHNALQRCMRDIHVVTQHAMVAQATFEIAGKAYLGLDLDAPF